MTLIAEKFEDWEKLSFRPNTGRDQVDTIATFRLESNPFKNPLIGGDFLMNVRNTDSVANSLLKFFS